MRVLPLVFTLIASLHMSGWGQVLSQHGEVATHWDQAFARVVPVGAQQAEKPELRGKVVAGYQGWFGAEGDGSGLGWKHFGGKDLGPGNCGFDLWPDLSELAEDEKYPTKFRNPDGSVAPLFSSYNVRTVDRHFKWMKEHGIDGVMLQRFGATLRSPRSYDFGTGVMQNVRRGAESHGRAWALMYDLSGMKADEVLPVITADWNRWVEQGKILEDRGYLHHRGKPLVAVWGVGFNDDRNYGLEECGRLIDFLKEKGNAVMLGVPYYWREQHRDALSDPGLHGILKRADIISPWSVGRYRGTAAVKSNVPAQLKADIAWTRENNLAYLPVLFPGFSWQNLEKGRGRDAPLNAIPREGGTFLWQQAVEAKRAGAEMIYVAMFDEVDEGTAIFKGSNQPPVGESRFMTYDGLPSDHYLWLTGEIGKMLRGPAGNELPMPVR